MIAIRRDEDVDNIHSVYVDQWDWEKIISKEEERTMETLINTVRSIYSVLRKTEKYMAVQYDYMRRDPSERNRFCIYTGACRYVP